MTYQELTGLAKQVYDDHRRAPATPFYDLFSLGKLFDSGAVQQLDEVYAQLEGNGFVERAPGGFVQFGGQIRPKYRVPAPNDGKTRKDAA